MYKIKKLFSKAFSAGLFFGCLIFVTHRGFKCFMKYMNPPEVMDVYYKFQGDEKLSFPSLTFCPLKQKQFVLRYFDTTSIKNKTK